MRRLVSPSAKSSKPQSRSGTFIGSAKKDKSMMSTTSQDLSSPSRKRKQFKEEMQNLLSDHMNVVGDKLQQLVLHKVSLEVPVQMQIYEDRLKKDLESILRGKIEEIFNSVQAFFNLKLKFLLNRLGYDTTDLDLEPYLENIEMSPIKLKFSETTPTSRYDEQQLRSIEKEIDTLEKTLESYKIPRTRSDQDPYEFDKTSLGFKAQEIRNDLIDQVNYDIRSTTEYLVQFSQNKIGELVRGEAGEIHHKLLNELGKNVQGLEEVIRKKFETLINDKINDLAERLTGNPKPKRPSPSKPQDVQGRQKLQQELKAISQEEQELMDHYRLKTPDTSSSKQSQTNLHKAPSGKSFQNTREKIEKLKNDLNFLDEELDTHPDKSLRRDELEEEHSRTYQAQASNFSLNFL